MVKKGFLRKTGCILISASIILAGWTFVGSVVSEAELDEEVAVEATVENSENEAVPEEILTEEVVTEEIVTGHSEEPEQEIVEEVQEEAPVLKSSDSTAPRYSDDGRTLEYVPAGVGNPFTVRDGTTTIAENAFSDSNVRILIFEDSSDIVTIYDQGSWPKAGTEVYCPNDEYNATGEVERFFQNVKTIPVYYEAYEANKYAVTITEVYGTNSETVNYNLAAGSVIKPRAHTGWKCTDTYTVTTDASQTYTFTYVEDSGTTGITVVITEKYGDTSTSVTYTDKIAGDIITPSSHTGYYCTDTYTVTSDANQTHTFTYVASTGETCSVTFKYQLYDAKYNLVATVDAARYQLEKGTTPTYATPSEYTYKNKKYYYMSGPDPTLAPVAVDTVYTITFISTSSSSGTNYTVTVYDEYYDSNMSTMTKQEIRSTNKYAEGSTYAFSPLNRTGYACWGGRNQSGTVTGDTKVYFFYKPINGGGSSSSSSSYRTTTPSATRTADTKGIYQVTQGANQSIGSNDGPIKITCNGPMEKLRRVMVDGADIPQGKYTLESGSTILTLTHGYIQSLASGNHVVRFEYTDGYAETNLTINGKSTTTVTYKVSSDGSISSGHTKDTTPKTADGFDVRYLLCMAIFLLGAGAILMGRQRKLEALIASQRED